MEPALIALLITAAANLLVSIGSAFPKGFFKAKCGDCCEMEMQTEGPPSREPTTEKN